LIWLDSWFVGQLGPVYTKRKHRYFPADWPLVYMKTPFLSQKTIISKHSSQLVGWLFGRLIDWTVGCLGG